MDFSSGIFALFINDLQFSDSKIGDFKFYYDSVSNDFIVRDKQDLRYPRSVVVEDPHFLIFRELPVKKKDEWELSFEVESYEMPM